MTMSAFAMVSALLVAAFYLGKHVATSQHRGQDVMLIRKNVLEQTKGKSLEEIEHMRMQADRLYANMVEDKKAKL